MVTGRLGRILRVQRPPLVSFAHLDIVAIGALSAARDSGYKIPEEISIVGYDNIANDQYLDYPLTTIAQADYQIGSHWHESFGGDDYIKRTIPSGQSNYV